MKSLLKQVGLTRRRMRDAANLPAKVAAQAPRVSVIVAARNNGRYLKEAFQSVLNQTVRCELIYSDDYSTDNSDDVAREFARDNPDHGMIRLHSINHLGVCEARNRAVRASTGTHLVHLDGDDVLTPTFVEDHLKAMTPGVPFVYGPAQAFGEGPRANIFWDVPRSWDETDLWAGNSCNTSSMYARWAFDAAGGWQDGIGTMWDWDLALRAARFGSPAPSRAVLRYRQHPASWSHEWTEFSDSTRSVFQSRVRELRARLSVGVVYGGRVGITFSEDWMHKIVASLRKMQLSEPPELVVLCTGCMDSQIFQCMSRGYEGFFSSIKLIDRRINLKYDSEVERRQKVATFLADSYNLLRRNMTGDIHWLIEDDVLVPLQAGTLLREQLVSGGWAPPAAATGLYRNRHMPDELVAGMCYSSGEQERHEPLFKPPTEPVPVDYAGTGCLMFWNMRTPRVWRPFLKGVPAHDWEWCFQLRQQGKRLIAVPGARCGHARSESDILY